MALDGKTKGVDLYGATPPSGVDARSWKGNQPSTGGGNFDTKNMGSQSPAPTSNKGGIPSGAKPGGGLQGS